MVDEAPVCRWGHPMSFAVKGLLRTGVCIRILDYCEHEAQDGVVGFDRTSLVDSVLRTLAWNLDP